jgi:hypothetical protein
MTKIGISYEDNWLICCEQIMFTVYSTAVSEINEIRNYMTDQFRRMDESARDVNKWTGLSDKFKFHSIFGWLIYLQLPHQKSFRDSSLQT